MKYLKYVFLIIYLSLTIFIFVRASASGEQSSKESDQVTDVVVGAIDQLNPSDESIVDIYGVDKVKNFIRKGIGHFGLFLVLGIFGVPTFMLFIKKHYLALILELISGFTIASISEIIQIFADNRGPSFKDVLLDFSGYLTSTLLIGLVLFIIYIIKTKKVVNA